MDQFAGLEGSFRRANILVTSQKHFILETMHYPDCIIYISLCFAARKEMRLPSYTTHAIVELSTFRDILRERPSKYPVSPRCYIEVSRLYPQLFRMHAYLPNGLYCFNKSMISIFGPKLHLSLEKSTELRQ